MYNTPYCTYTMAISLWPASLLLIGVRWTGRWGDGWIICAKDLVQRWTTPWQYLYGRLAPNWPLVKRPMRGRVHRLCEEGLCSKDTFTWGKKLFLSNRNLGQHLYWCVWGCRKRTGKGKRKRCCPHPSSIIEDFGGLLCYYYSLCLLVCSSNTVHNLFFFKNSFKKGKKKLMNMWMKQASSCFRSYLTYFLALLSRPREEEEGEDKCRCGQVSSVRVCLCVLKWRIFFLKK